MFLSTCRMLVCELILFLRLRLNSLEASVTSQDVVPRLFDQHPIHRENMESNLNENVLEGREIRAETVDMSWLKLLYVRVLCSSCFHHSELTVFSFQTVGQDKHENVTFNSGKQFREMIKQKNLHQIK